MPLSDREFATQFENLKLDPVHFNHVGHLRICWLYLHQYELQTAINHTCNGIQSYATSLGATGKFHRTITEFLVRLINSRINGSANDCFDVFLEQNRDLVDDAQQILTMHYSKSILAGDAARVNYIQPDLIHSSF